MKNIIPDIGEVIAKDIHRKALIRYYSEHLSMKIMEIEKLRNEALEIQRKLIEVEGK